MVLQRNARDMGHREGRRAPRNRKLPFSPNPCPDNMPRDLDVSTLPETIGVEPLAHRNSRNQRSSPPPLPGGLGLDLLPPGDRRIYIPQARNTTSIVLARPPGASPRTLLPSHFLTGNRACHRAAKAFPTSNFTGIVCSSIANELHFPPLAHQKKNATFPGVENFDSAPPPHQKPQLPRSTGSLPHKRGFVATL